LSGGEKYAGSIVKARIKKIFWENVLKGEIGLEREIDRRSRRFGRFFTEGVGQDEAREARV